MGETAFTAEFKASVDKTTLMARRLEVGCINTGLKSIFNELRVKGNKLRVIFTFNFVVTAGVVKVQPVKAEPSVNIDKLSQNLHKTIDSNAVCAKFGHPGMAAFGGLAPISRART